MNIAPMITKKKLKKTRVKTVAPDDDCYSITFEDGFQLGRTERVHKVRKVATRTQAGTNWGYVEDYLLCCESKRTRKRLRQNQTGKVYIEVLSDNEELATNKKSKKGND